MLKNKQILQGKVEKKGEYVIIITGYGDLKVHASDIAIIDTSKKSKVQEYLGLYEEIKDSANADDFYRLAKWAKESRLPRYVNELLQKTIELDNNHEFARQELGYKLYNGRWQTQEEIMQDKGFVKYKGRWVTQAEKELMLAKQLEKQEERRRQEEERKKRIEERRKKQEEAQRRYQQALAYYYERTRLYKYSAYNYPLYYWPSSYAASNIQYPYSLFPKPTIVITVTAGNITGIVQTLNQ